MTPTKNYRGLITTLNALMTEEQIDWSLPVREALLKAGVKTIPADDEWRDVAWWGPIDAHIRDPQVHDLCINGPGRDMIVGRAGKQEVVSVALHRDWIILFQNKLIGSRLGPKQNPLEWSDTAATPRLGVGRGGDGLRRMRYTATREGLTPDGPTLTLRILPDEWAGLDDLVAEEVLPKADADVLRRAIRSRHVNVVIAGGTGSGKTTLAAALKREMGEIRCVVVQDVPEIPTGDPFNDVSFVLEDGDEHAFLEAVRTALRVNVERVVLGEGRGAELWAMIQAGNTGHPILTTLHATDGIEVFQRLESYATAAKHVTPHIVRANIINLDVLVVYMARSEVTGKRQVTQIVELRRGSSTTPGEPYECAVVRELQHGQLTVIEPIRGAWAKEMQR